MAFIPLKKKKWNKKFRKKSVGESPDKHFDFQGRVLFLGGYFFQTEAREFYFLGENEKYSIIEV